MRCLGLVVALTFGFAVGFVFAKQSAQPAQQKSPTDDFVAKVQAELDASGKQVVTEVWTALQMLKDAVKEAPVPPAPMPEFERKIKVAGGRIMAAVEVTALQGLIGAMEKSTIVMPEWDAAVFDRIVQFFNADAEEVKALRKKGLTWAGIITGYGIAKVTGKLAKEVFAHYEKEKAWAKVALDLGLPATKLGEALKGLFP